jgi:hypothetical protein
LMSSVGDRESESQWKKLRERLDAELAALPRKYRAPLVLCYLEGKTHLEAAQILGWPSGSISARVARGRELLRCRLAGRDEDLNACIFPFLLGCWITEPPLSPRLVQATVSAALAALPGRAARAALAASAARASKTQLPQRGAGIRPGRMLKLTLAVAIALMSFSAIAYAFAGPDFLAALGLRGSAGVSPGTPAHSCH